MPVGSSCSIVYMLYKENHIEIPKNIAGLLLSGILSDTLILKSPTTTEIDKSIAMELSNLIDVDYEKYGMEMYQAGTSLKGRSKEDITYTDFKIYPVDERKMGIGQIFTVNINEILDEKEEYIKILENIGLY